MSEYAAITTLIPAEANLEAIAFPIPLDEPVTSAHSTPYVLDSVVACVCKSESWKLEKVKKRKNVRLVER